MSQSPFKKPKRAAALRDLRDFLAHMAHVHGAGVCPHCGHRGGS